MSARDDFLPSFSSVTEVQEENTMIDRFELEIGDWALDGEVDDICQVLNHLDYYTLRTANGSEVQLLAGGNLRGISGKVQIPFASGGSGSSVYSARPALSGKLVRAGRRQAQFRNIPAGRMRLSFQTSLNLGRFIQAQEFRKSSNPRNPNLVGDLSLAIECCDDWHKKEVPLLPATNLIMGQVHRFGYARYHPLERHLDSYLSSVVNTLTDCLETPLRDQGMRFFSCNYRSLRSLEMYWEFSDPDPVGLVDRLIHPLRRLSHQVSLTREILDDYREDINADSWCVTLALTANIRLRIYAKTTHRVRFEVDFTADAIDDICGRRTADSNAGIVNMVDALRRRAIEEMNWVLSELNRDTPQVESPHTAVGLVHEIVSRVDDAATSQAIVSLLQTFGRVAPRDNQPLRDTVHKLSADHVGVLRTLRRHSPVYVVRDEWQAALDELQASNRRET